jgi:hypothetical protein
MKHDFGDIGSINLDADAFAPSGGKKLDRNTRHVLPKRHRAVPMHAVKYERAAELARDMAANIAGGDTVTAILSGNFIFGDVFEAFAYETGMPIDNLTLSTLSFSDENVCSLSEMMKAGKLGRLNILVSDFFWAHNRKNADYIYDMLDIDDRFQLAVAGIHTKISLIKAGSRKIVVSGSANMRSSRCIEAVTFETNDALYDFHMDWHMALIDAHKTINKSVRAREAFVAIGGTGNVSIG